MNNNLKVAYILHRFPSLTETFILREMCRIREERVEINIFSLLPPKHTTVHEQATEWLPVTHYGPYLSLKVLKAQLHFLRRSPRRYLRALAKTIWQTYREPVVLLGVLALFPKIIFFARQMEELEIDHIHAHFVWLGGIAAGVVADVLDITFTIHPHAFGLFERNQQNVRIELENASKIVTISNYHRTYIAKLCAGIDSEDIELVHLGVDTDHFRPASKLSNRRSIRILSIGRFIEKKGHGFLIDACKLLAERGLAFQCQIVGGGPLESALQTRIGQHKLQDQVTLLEALEQDQILELYQTTDIFALPCILARSGDRDGMPYVLIEAMACGLPVVTTPLMGILELVHDRETGLLVKERDVSGLANALEQLMIDEDLRLRLGTQARQLTMKEFQIKHTVAKLAAIFRQVSRSAEERFAMKSLPKDKKVIASCEECMKPSAGNRVLMLLENAPYPSDSRVRPEATTLVAAGYQVSVICPGLIGQPWRETVDGVQVYRYLMLVQGNGLLGYLFEYGYALAATFIISWLIFFRPGFDIIHAHNPPDLYVLIAMVYKLFGKRFIFDQHDLAPELYAAHFEGSRRWVYHLLVWFETLSCRLADHVIVANQSHKRLNVERGSISEKRITIVRNGPDLNILRSEQPEPGLCQAEKTILCYVGVISTHDGVDCLLRALQRLVIDLNRSDFFCVLVGAGSAWLKMKSLSEQLRLTDQILFTGWVGPSEVARYISAADICVAPEPSNSYNDRTTVIKIAEYMALGKPIVAFDLPEHRVTAQAAAVYARPNDEFDFASQIAWLMNNPQRRKEMGRIGRQRVETELAWKYQAENLVAVYESLGLRPEGSSA